jgi:DNA primase small subunit
MKSNTNRLIEEFLIPDFGFERKEMKVSFSGLRGFHVYVLNSEVKNFNSAARKQLVDYVQGRGINIKTILHGAALGSKGWKGRAARALYDSVANTEPKNLRKAGLVKSAAFNTEERKKEILAALSKGAWGVIPRNFFWSFEKQIAHLGVKIDESVTLDISKLVRAPSTLHGGSGLLCMYVDNIDKFNPFRDAIVFYNPPMKIKVVADVPEFCLKEQTFGPFGKDSTVEIPEYAALFLICREKALVQR